MCEIKREDGPSGCWSGAIYMFENWFTVPGQCWSHKSVALTHTCAD